MKSFTHWLDSRQDIKHNLEAGIDAYLSIGSRPRGQGVLTGTAAQSAERFTLALKAALDGYYSDVVGVTFANLPEASRKALKICWDQILHAKFAGQNLTGISARIDEFAKSFRVKKGIALLWEDYPIQRPPSADVFIPEIGGGFSDSYKMAKEGTCIDLAGPVELEGKSKTDFEAGEPGTAWLGLLTIGSRTGLGKNLAFLYPAELMEKHITASHQHERHPDLPKPAIQWGGAGHQEAIVNLITSHRMNLNSWNGFDAHDPRDAAGTGCIAGFAIKKAYDVLGHQWAFTSATCNPYAIGEWEGSKLKRKADGFQLPAEWAIKIWDATKDLAGNIYVRGALTDPRAVPAKQPPPPPPPPPGAKGPAANKP